MVYGTGTVDVTVSITDRYTTVYNPTYSWIAHKIAGLLTGGSPPGCNVITTNPINIHALYIVAICCNAITFNPSALMDDNPS